MTWYRDNKIMLVLNLAFLISYLLIGMLALIDLSLLCAFHILLLFFMMKRIIKFTVNFTKISNYLINLSLVNAIFLVGFHFYIFNPSDLWLGILISARLAVALMTLMLLYEFVFKSIKSWTTVYILLEFALVFFVLTVLIISGYLPFQTLSGKFKLLEYLGVAINILDYGTIIACVATTLFLFKYEDRFVFNPSLLLSLAALGISFGFLNVSFFSHDLNVYFLMMMTMMFAYVFFIYFFVIYSYEPLLEISEYGSVDFKIKRVREHKTLILTVVLSFLLLLLNYLKITTQEIQAYLFLILAVYMILSFQLEKSVLNYLILDRERKRKEAMNSIVINRNEDMKLSNAKLEYIATHDRFTKLPNRESFIRNVESLIDVDKSPFSFILLTIDNLDTIRNLYNVNISRKLVLSFIKRLRSVLSEREFIYQLSRDEYAVISSNDDIEFFESFYKSLHYLSLLDYKVDEISFAVRLKVGFSRYPHEVSSLRELFIMSDLMAFEYKPGSNLNQDLKNAEEIMRNLTQKNKYSAFLKEAKFDDEFMLYFQPQFDLANKDLIGAETLIRWKRKGEFISPGIFIPIAETIGQIPFISEWVARKSVITLQKWKQHLPKGFRLGINISPLILNSDMFFDYFRSFVADKKADLEDYEFEITEYTELRNSPDIYMRLQKISESGINISIDDFGTGYSSLSYINMYKVNRLKIAKELVDEIETSADIKSIVSAIIEMARTLGMTTIAEGVEQKAQLDILKDLGCDQLQGYIWGRPMPTEEFEERFF